MRRNLHRFALAVLATSTFASTYASTSRADDAELEGLLDENVVTTASKSSELGSTAPATSTVITAEQIHEYGMLTVGEAIDFLSLGAAGGSNGPFGVRGVTIENDGGAHLL